MSEISRLEEIEQQYDHLVQAGAYAEALELINREGHLFPDYSQKVICSWRIEMASRLGNAELTLQLLQEAVQAGHWYGGLRGDPDLALLRGRPEFERLVDLCEQRRIAAIAAAQPVLTTIPPEKGPAPFPLLIALHGANATAEGGHWSPAAAHGWFVAIPQSSQVYAPGTYTWNDRQWAIQEVRAHYDRLRAEFPIDPERVVLAGFSQGGGLATSLALSETIPARGLILVGPFLPDVNAVVPLLEEHDMRGLRAYLVAGLRDRYCYGIARQLAEILPRYGVVCQLEVCADLEHMFPDDFDQRLPAALDFVLP